MNQSVGLDTFGWRGETNSEKIVGRREVPSKVARIRI